MIRQIVLSAEAFRDLDAIWDYTIETWSAEQAESYLSGLDRVLHLLAEQPQIARERSEIRPGARLHAYGKHLILFTASADTLAVVRIVHAQADWLTLLAD